MLNKKKNLCVESKWWHIQYRKVFVLFTSSAGSLASDLNHNVWQGNTSKQSFPSQKKEQYFSNCLFCVLEILECFWEEWWHNWGHLITSNIVVQRLSWSDDCWKRGFVVSPQRGYEELPKGERWPNCTHTARESRSEVLWQWEKVCRLRVFIREREKKTLHSKTHV